MAGTSRKGHINHIQLTLNIEEVQLQEVGEVSAERTYLWTQSQLAKLILSLDENLILIRDQGRVPWSSTQLGNLVEDQVVAY